MTTTVYDPKQPLIAGSAFVFPVVLFQRANGQLIQTSVTLAVGDVKISLDGAGYANITTLPTEVGATGELIVSLSALETTGALKYISVKFSDVAGAEWCDVVYVIDVEEGKTVSDYSGGDTSGVTTILADYARRTGDYATVGAAMSLIDDAITAAVIATDALGALELSVDASAEISAAIWDTLLTSITTPATVGKLIKDNLDAAVSTRAVPEDVSVAISSTVAASVSTGTMAIEAGYTFRQSVTSTIAQDLSAATKIWLAVKDIDDVDTASIIYIEETAGLTRVDGAAYTTIAHGSLTVTGSSGAWEVAVYIDEIATALLFGKNRGYSAGLKARIGDDVVSIWGSANNCSVIDGVVRAV